MDRSTPPGMLEGEQGSGLVSQSEGRVASRFLVSVQIVHIMVTQRRSSTLVVRSQPAVAPPRRATRRFVWIALGAQQSWRTPFPAARGGPPHEVVEVARRQLALRRLRQRGVVTQRRRRHRKRGWSAGAQGTAPSRVPAMVKRHQERSTSVRSSSVSYRGQGTARRPPSRRGAAARAREAACRRRREARGARRCLRGPRSLQRRRVRTVQ